MQTDWVENEKLRIGWLNAVGSTDYPFGDIHREVIVNPSMLSCMLEAIDAKANRRRSPIRYAENLLHHVTEQVTKGMPPYAAVRDWYASLVSGSTIEKSKARRVLDLGCGEGYLGRLLRKLGFTYVGLDVCEEFLAAGYERYKKEFRKRKVDSSEYSLNLVNLDVQDLDLEEIASSIRTPDFAVFECVLEHLSDPQPVVSAVSRYLLRHNPRSAVLVVVSNPDYDLKEGLTDDKMLDCAANVCICSLNQDVDIVVRPWHNYLRLFRENHFRTTQSSLLHFQRQVAVLLSHMTEQHLLDIAPFFFFEFSLISQDISQAREEQIAAAIRLAGLESLTRTQKETFVKSSPECSVYGFAPGQRMFDRNDIGENLWIVLEGSAKLSGTGVPFEVGDFIGDLEITGVPSHPPVFYRYPGEAGSRGCKVLNVPYRVVRRLEQTEGGLSKRLFEQLSTKLRSQVWLWDIPEKSLEHVNEFAGLSSYLPRLASVLVWGCQTAADSGPRSLLRGEGCFLPTAEIVRRGFPRQTKVGKQVVDCLYSLVGLGVIDAYPGARILRLRSELRESLSDLFLFAVKGAVRAWFSDLETRDQEGVISRLHGKLSVEQKLWSKKYRDESGDLQIGMRRYLQSLGETSGQNYADLDSKLNSVFEYITLISQWVYEGSPSLIIVREPMLLRMIATGDSSIVPLVQSRLSTLGVENFDRDTIVRAASIGRLRRYVDLMRSFVGKDLETPTPNLHFTGDSDRNFFDIYPNRVTKEV